MQKKSKSVPIERVSSGAHGLKVIATDLSEVESAICEVSNGHCTTSTCTTNPVCHDPSRRIARIERRARAVAEKGRSFELDAAATPLVCTRQDASSLTAIASPLKTLQGKPDILACPLDLLSQSTPLPCPNLLSQSAPLPCPILLNSFPLHPTRLHTNLLRTL